MRRRLRDWPIRVYRYWAEPLGVVPPALWEQARAMQTAWNALVVARGRVADATAMERACLCGDDHRPRITARWAAWNEEARTLVAGLGWECGPAVLDRFTATCIAASRGQRGWPRQHHRLDRLAIPHRWTAGGAPVSALRSSRATRLSLSHHGADARGRELVRGRFGLKGGASIRFLSVLHRPLPEDGILKQAAWLGQRHPTRGWQWALAVTVEEAPSPARLTAGTVANAVGLDLGWRLMGDYLRIGMLVDEAGEAIELRLPLAAPTSHSRRHRLKSDWRDLVGMDAAIASLLETTKAMVRPLLPALSGLPDEVRGLVAQWDRVRQGGLIRLLRAIESRPSGGGNSARVLQEWRAQNDHLRALRMALWDRLIGRREWLYHNLAAWVCETWSMIVWEGDLSIKRMAEAPDKTPALDAADRYRQIVAPGIFRAALRQAAATRGAALVDKPAAYTTRTCAMCGDVLDEQDGSSLWLVCGNGHRWDQDENAARNLVSQIGGVPSESTRGSAWNLESNAAEVVSIPDHLKAVAVRVRAE